ncbi:MAG TPA: DUF4214 domain-containing protein, partial [Telluria sp.]|nr:DUF4214 domain-containing protein [Telluria sp.]
MGIYTEAIQQLYIAYFSRPADVAGLEYWEHIVTQAKGNTAAVSAAFAASHEYQETYANMTPFQLVAKVYANLFGHSPDQAGLHFWANALANKQVTVDDMVAQVAKGAQGADLVAFNSKVGAATAFTASLDLVQEVLLYSGGRANNVLKNFIANVFDEATMRAASTPDALQKVIDQLINAGTEGQGFSLSAGRDVLVGTDGNDVFGAWAFDPVTGNAGSTFSTTDFVDGGAGNDVLNIEIKDGQNTSFGNTRGIETINIRASAATAVDASLFQGATLITQSGSAGAVTDLAEGATAGFAGSAIGGALSVRAAGASAGVALTGVSDTASLAISGPTLNTVTVSGLRVHAGDGAVAALTVNVTAGTDVQTVRVNTTQKTALTLSESASSSVRLHTLDATASTGAITFDATSTPGVSTIKTGSGDDLITAVKGSGSLGIYGGDGNDAIMVTGRLASGDVIDGGAGNNTLVLAVSGTAAANDPILNTVIKNFSNVKIIDTSAKGGLDASQLGSGFTTLSLGAGSVVTNVGSQTLLAHGNLTATATGYVAGESYAGNLNVTATEGGAITAMAESLALAVKANLSGVITSIGGDVRSASVQLTNGVASSGADTIASVGLVNSSLSMASLASLTLSGSGSASVVNVNGTALATIDASALGGRLSATNAATQGLTYTSTNTKSETIKLGTGIDHISIGASTYDSIDTIRGLNLVLNSAGTGLAAGSDRLEVTGVGSGVKVFTTSQSTLGLALIEAAA